MFVLILIFFDLGLACLLTFLLSLTQLFSTVVGFIVALPWMIHLFLNGHQLELWSLILFHVLGMNYIETAVMSANKKLDRVKSPYLTAFALYLGVAVYGLPGLLVGPLGLSIMIVLYESMAEEEDSEDEEERRLRRKSMKLKYSKTIS